MRRIARCLVATSIAGAAVALVGTAALAAETITHTYDARGRRVKVERTGTVNNNVKTEYELDKASNRKWQRRPGPDRVQCVEAGLVV